MARDLPLTHVTIADLLTRWPRAARVLVRHRMACVGCAIAPFESVADAATIYHLRVDRFVRELRRAIGAQDPRPSRGRPGRRRGRGA